MNFVYALYTPLMTFPPQESNVHASCKNQEQPKPIVFTYCPLYTNALPLILQTSVSHSATSLVFPLKRKQRYKLKQDKKYPTDDCLRACKCWSRAHICRKSVYDYM